MRAISVLLVILLSAPLLMMTAGAYLIDGQDILSSYPSDTMVPISAGSGMGSQLAGIPTSIGFSIPDFSCLASPSMGQLGDSSFNMPDTDVSDLIGPTGISSIQGCLDNIGSLTSGIVDVSDFVTLLW